MFGISWMAAGSQEVRQPQGASLEEPRLPQEQQDGHLTKAWEHQCEGGKIFPPPI